MSATQLILFDDRTARAWEPFALTRPAGELLFGTATLRARAERAMGLRCAEHVAAEHLVGFEEAGAPSVVAVPSATANARVFLCSRAVLEAGAADSVERWDGRAATLTVDGQPVGWMVPAGSAAPDAESLLDPGAVDSSAMLDLPGSVLRNVWELVSLNPDQIARDLRTRFRGLPEVRLPDGVHRLGDDVLAVADDVRIEPGVVLDTRSGPIRLEPGSAVRAFTRLAGPAWIGPGSTLLGGPIEAVSIGPVCRVRGELAESICLGYTNKQHDGHIGHAYLGRWVNLGAETTNSDLKNNYGTIRMWTPEGPVDTGLIKLGSLLGDHVKTGIGLLLNTGTVIGAGSNLYGAEMPPTHVPPFSWGSGSELTEYRVDKFLEVAERAMGRRDVDLPVSMRRLLERAAGLARSRRGD
jgi:UDP-N-acetylglucosamine diphosphorylase / glucose-1-phosphate thymidylyltransferase / UDP-N-acetylgalactosamine diphosphorylase / glucosamine-1-phosphate N-acetyltransferase / galactosamine-1-phosphate N-acetyltransferase